MNKYKLPLFLNYVTLMKRNSSLLVLKYLARSTLIKIFVSTLEEIHHTNVFVNNVSLTDRKTNSFISKECNYLICTKARRRQKFKISLETLKQQKTKISGVFSLRNFKES